MNSCIECGEVGALQNSKGEPVCYEHFKADEDKKMTELSVLDIPVCTAQELRELDVFTSFLFVMSLNDSRYCKVYDEIRQFFVLEGQKYRRRQAELATETS